MEHTPEPSKFFIESGGTNAVSILICGFSPLVCLIPNNYCGGFKTQMGLIKKINFTLLSIAVLGTTQVTSAQELTELEIITECTQTIQRSAIYLDQGDAERYSNLFVEDGAIVINGNATESRNAIAERVRSGDPSELDRHFNGSIVIDVEESGAITAKSYALVYEGEAPESPGPVAISEYILVDYDDQMRMTNTGCKFVRRELATIFDSEG